MIDYSVQNKKAWEYNAYDFWVKEAGLPADRAQKIVANPVRALRRYANYFDTYKGIRVANICGSCGKKAVPLAVLGADVTVFDISKDNKRYALELADAAGVQIDYQVCDVQEAKHNIRCNAVLPGMTATEAVENNLTEEFRSLFMRHIPLGRMGLPKEVAGTVVYLASDEAAYTTGQIITVSGGFGLGTPVYADLINQKTRR